MKTIKKRFNVAKVVSLFVAFSILFQLFPIGVVASAQLFDEDGKEISIQLTNLSEAPESKPILGALYEINGNGYNTISMTDSSGAANFIELAPGDYTITELDVPSPYVKNTEPIPVTVIAGETILLSRQTIAAKGKITVSKVEIGTLAPIEGTIFEVMNEYDVVVDTITTDFSGVAISENLETGVYFIKEKTASNGYSLNTEIKQVNLFYENSSTPLVEKAVTFEGVQIKGQVKLTSKESGTENPVVGAKYRLTTSDNMLLGMYTTDSNGEILIDTLDLGDYILTEFSVPEGYVATNEAHNFTIANLDPVTINTFNDHTKIDISLRDVLTDYQIEGSTLRVINSDDQVVAEFETTNMPHTLNGLPKGEYTISQVSPSPGYIKSPDVQFTLASTVNLQNALMLNDFTKVSISNQHVTTNEEVSGSTLQILREGVKYHEWETGDEPYEITKLPVGQYILREKTAPVGYAASPDMTFEVLPTVDVQDVTMDKDYTKVSISVVDVNTDEMLPESTLQIVNSFDEILHEWVSTEEPHLITQLPVGEYILREKIPTAGYLPSSDIEFTVSPVSEPLEITLNKDYTKVQFSLKDISTDKEIAGATLKIMDTDGEVYEEWTTESTPHVILGLPAGFYTLSETSVTGGYILAENIDFIVEANGTVKMVEMKNDFTKVQIGNIDSESNMQVPGIDFEIIDADGKVVKSWTSTEAPYEIKYLPIGKYTLRETKTADGYVTSKETAFEVTSSDKVQTVDVKHVQTKVQFSVQDIKTGEELSGVTLKIMDSEGVIVQALITSDTPQTVKSLPVGKYTLLKMNTLPGYIPSESIEFEVKNTEDVQVITSKLDFTKVQLSILDAETLAKLNGATLMILDSDEKVVQELVASESMEIERLPIGSYILRVKTAEGEIPEMEDVLFEVGSSGAIKTISIKISDPTEIPEDTETEVDPDTETEEDEETVIDPDAEKDKEDEAVDESENTEGTDADKTAEEKFPDTGVASTTSWFIAGILMLGAGASLFFSSSKSKKKLA